MSELDPELARLFRAARRDEDPTDEDRRAVRRGVAARLATAAAAGAAATLGARGVAAAGGALGKASLFGSFAAGLGAGALVGAAVTVLVVYGGRDEPAATTAPVSAAAPPPEAPARSGSHATIERPTEAAPSVSVPVEQPRPPRATSSAAPSLEAETRALGDVQRALRDGRPDEALRLLAEQEKTFARGALHEERLAARVLALCGAGRVAEGRRTRDAFLSKYPNSPAADRVRASCAP